MGINATAALSQSQLDTIEQAVDYARKTGGSLPSPFGLRAELQRQADAFLARLAAAEEAHCSAVDLLTQAERHCLDAHNEVNAQRKDLDFLQTLGSQLLRQLAGRSAECRVQAILEDLRDRVHLVTKFAYAPQWSEADRLGVDFVVWPHNCDRPLELQVKASESEGHRFLDERTLASIEHELDRRAHPPRYIQLIVVAGKPQSRLAKEIERVIREWKRRFPLHAS